MAEQGHTEHASSPELANNTYFSTLSCDELKKVTLHPVYGDFMCLLFADGSPFRCIKSSFVNCLEVTIGGGSCVQLQGSTVKIDVNELDGSAEKVAAIERMFKIFGSSITCIKYDPVNLRQGETKWGKIIPLIVENCRNVKDLQFVCFFTICKGSILLDLLVEEYGSQLRSLTFERINDDAECPNLNGCDIMKLGFHCVTISTLIPALISVGCALEELYLRSVYGDNVSDLVDANELHCRKLSVIYLRGVVGKVGGGRYTNFLISYGEQLVKANVDDLNSDNLRKIT